MTVIVSPAYAGVEALPTPRQARRSGQPRACGGEGEFVAEAITTRRRSVSVMVFLPERCTLTRWAGIEDVWFIFNPRRLLLPVLAVTVRRPGEPQCDQRDQQSQHRRYRADDGENLVHGSSSLCS